jgi:predicted GTPase
MSNSAIQMYALGLDQIATAIRFGGNERTILVQGHMGTGKSSLLNTLSRDLPDHTPCYFDCTTKDLGDITIPKMSEVDGADYVKYRDQRGTGRTQQEAQSFS